MIHLSACVYVFIRMDLLSLNDLCYNKVPLLFIQKKSTVAAFISVQWAHCFCFILKQMYCKVWLQAECLFLPQCPLNGPLFQLTPSSGWLINSLRSANRNHSDIFLLFPLLLAPTLHLFGTGKHHAVLSRWMFLKGYDSF